MDIKEKFYSKLKQLREAEEQQNESVMADVATGLAMGAAGGLLGGGAGMLLHGKYGKKKKSVMDRLSDTRSTKSFQKYQIAKADKDLKRASRPKTIERLTKQKTDASEKLKKTSYLKSLLPEEEQLDELRKPKDIDKLRKHMKDAASAASDASYKKGSDHYDEASRKRKKAIGSKKTADVDDANAEQAKMSKEWKRSMKFGKIADKKEKLEEDQLNEISKKTLGSYIKKATKDVTTGKNVMGHNGFLKPSKRIKNIAKATDRLTK